MKMSDVFPTPLNTDLMKVEGEVAAFDCTGNAAFAAVHAVNNHDSLVELLETSVVGLEWYKTEHPQSWSSADDEHLTECRKLLKSINKE